MNTDIVIRQIYYQKMILNITWIGFVITMKVPSFGVAPTSAVSILRRRKMSDLIKDARAFCRDIEDAFPGTYKTFEELVEKLIAEVERLLEDNEMGKELLVKGVEVVEDLEDQIKSLTKELEAARPGWCPICHERIYNEVNKKVKDLTEDADLSLQRIEDLTEEQDEWEDKANRQCIRNDELQKERDELREKEEYWRISYYKKEKQFTDSEQARKDAEDKLSIYDDSKQDSA